MNRNHPHRAALATAALAAAALAGCSAHERENRADDWAQIVTLTVGDGVGAQARLGPARLGLYKGEDRAGLRAGEFGSSWDTHDNYDYLWLAYGREYFGGWATDKRLLQARKVTAVTQYFPLINETRVPAPHGFIDLSGAPKTARGGHNSAYWTQLELTLGIGGSLRVGFNPGELLDAVLGHIGIDIYRDDLPDLTPPPVTKRHALPAGSGGGVLPAGPVAPKTSTPALP